MTIAFIVQSGSRFWSRYVLPLKADLNFRTQTVPRRFYRLQQRDKNIRRQVAFEQIITTVKGFSNSCPCVVSVAFHNSAQALMIRVPSTMQAAKFFLSKEYFSDLHFNDSTNLLSDAASANAYLTSNRCFMNTV